MQPNQPLPESDEKPKDFASMMNSLESKAIQKKQEQEELEYDDEDPYYNEAENMFKTLQQDPNMFASMLSQLSLNPNVSKDLVNNLASQINTEYKKVKNEDGYETIYTSDGQMMRIQVEDRLPDDLVDDDDIIDYFLENNSDWTICEYFVQGTCRYGDGCKYAHPESMRPKGFENGMGGYIKG